MTILTILWAVFLVGSILMLCLPSQIVNTTCKFTHAGYVLWVVAALFGIAGHEFVGLALVLIGFGLMLFCLMSVSKIEI